MITEQIVDGEKRNLYMDGGLYKQLTESVAPSVQKKDKDWFCIVDGEEGCLTGDTIINTNRNTLGRKFRLDYMYKQYHQRDNVSEKTLKKRWDIKTPTYVRSFDGNSIKLHKIKDVVYSGKKEVWELNLENGRKIKATRDHKIMTKDGWKELQELNNEDMIMCDTLRPQRGNQKSYKLRDHLIRCPFHPFKDRHGDVSVHRLSYEANINKLKFMDFLDILWNDENEAKNLEYINPDIFHIHHKDGNHYNNSIDNLELIEKENHLLLHAKKDESFRNFNQGIPIFSKVESIMKRGIEKTYDIICEEPHRNFVANGIVVHNSGKSVFAMQIAKILDPKFTHEQVAFNPAEFIRLVMKSKKNQCIILDEAYNGLSSRSALSEMNNLMVSLMMEMRQKNLFVIIVMPTFFMLDKYCALHRAKGLFHIYTRDGDRGYWHFFDKRKMKFIYLNGKKFYEYGSEKPRIFGRFYDQYMVNEEEYRRIKSQALHKKKRGTKAEVYKQQRDTLFWLLSHEYKMSQQKIADMCKKWGYTVGRRTIADILTAKKTEVIIKKALSKEEDKETNEKVGETQQKPFVVPNVSENLVLAGEE